MYAREDTLDSVREIDFKVVLMQESIVFGLFGCHEGGTASLILKVILFLRIRFIIPCFVNLISVFVVARF